MPASGNTRIIEYHCIARFISMSLDDEHAASTLGERLLVGVRKLWREVHRHGKVIDYQGEQIEDLKKRLRSFERDMQGLRISRGRAKAKSAKLEAALTESAAKLAEIKSVLN
jgi:hypothetical protein